MTATKKTKTAEAIARADVAAETARAKALNKERNRLWQERRLDHERRAEVKGMTLERIRDKVELEVMSKHFPKVPTDTRPEGSGHVYIVVEPSTDDYIPGLDITLRNARGESLIEDNLIDETAQVLAQAAADDVFYETYTKFYRDVFTLNLKTELARPGRDEEIAADEVRRDLDRRTFVYWDHDQPIYEEDEDGVRHMVDNGTRVEKVFDTVAERDAFKAKHYAEAKAKREAEKAEAEAEVTSGNVITFPGRRANSVTRGISASGSLPTCLRLLRQTNKKPGR
jgi:hypothetical protein